MLMIFFLGGGVLFGRYCAYFTALKIGYELGAENCLTTNDLCGFQRKKVIDILSCRLRREARL